MTDISILKGDQLKQALELSQYAFQYTLSDEEVENKLEKQQDHIVYGIYEDDQLASKLNLIPFQVLINDQQFSMGGIASVATWPEFRRKKYVTQLLTKALETMRENSQVVSYLHPFKVSFYRKFGWDLISSYAKIEVPQQDLIKLRDSSGIVKRLPKEESIEVANRIYEQYAEKYNALLKRTSSWWNHFVMTNEYKTVIYYNDSNEASGYLLYKVKENTMDVQEMVFLTEDARRGLWNFICQHDSMVEKVTIVTSEDDPLPYLLHNPKVKREVKPYFMGRIVDVHQFLKQYTFAKNESLFLHVYDEYAPWNNGTFHIHDGDVAYYPQNKDGSSCAHPPKRGLQVNISALSAMFIGSQRPFFLYEAGLITGNEKDVEKLEEMIQSKHSFFIDFF
jgi:predicted acetyltransferase